MKEKKPGTNLSNTQLDMGKCADDEQLEVKQMAGRPKNSDQKKAPKFKSLDEVKSYAKKKYGI